MFCIHPTWHLNVADCPGLAVTLFMIFWMFGFPHVLTEEKNEKKYGYIVCRKRLCTIEKGTRFLSMAAL